MIAKFIVLAAPLAADADPQSLYVGNDGDLSEAAHEQAARSGEHAAVETYAHGGLRRRWRAEPKGDFLEGLRRC